MQTLDVKLGINLSGNEVAFKWIKVKTETKHIKLAMDTYRHVIRKVMVDSWESKDWMNGFEYAGDNTKSGETRVVDGKKQFAVLVTFTEYIQYFNGYTFKRYGPYWVTADTLEEATKIVNDTLSGLSVCIEELWEKSQAEIVDIILEDA